MVAAHVFETLQTALVPRAGTGAVSHGVLVLHLSPDELLTTVRRLRDEFDFDVFLDVTAIDWLGQPQAATARFEVVHHFYSSVHNRRIRLKTRAPESAPVVPSLVTMYGSAAFMERECHDMYGIRFEGNADLRPILLYEGFEGHPLRKDYPKQREQPLVPYRN